MLSHVAMWFSRDKWRVPYDPAQREYVISPIKYTVPPSARYIVAKSDQWILENMSTSPFAEAPGFADEIRSTFEFLLQHPDWREVGQWRGRGRGRER